CRTSSRSARHERGAARVFRDGRLRFVRMDLVRRGCHRARAERGTGAAPRAGPHPRDRAPRGAPTRKVMTPRHKRMLTVGLILAGMGLATAFILQAFNSNLMYFYSPSEVEA